VVAGDLGVRKAVGLAYLDNHLPSESEVRQAIAHWGECAGVAQALLLTAVGEGVLRRETPRSFVRRNEKIEIPPNSSR